MQVSAMVEGGCESVGGLWWRESHKGCLSRVVAQM